ncbi:MAG: L,D-transpeptidase family protein [Bifidobacteriaceae bacterium]|nr:L,D-transpeptidase family protein [Bifidobacteriaceae bacterium]
MPIDPSDNLPAQVGGDDPLSESADEVQPQVDVDVKREAAVLTPGEASGLIHGQLRADGPVDDHHADRQPEAAVGPPGIAPNAQPEPEADSEPGSDTEPAPRLSAESETEPEPGPDAETVFDPGTDAAPETNGTADNAADHDSEPSADAEPNVESEAGTEFASDPVMRAQPETHGPEDDPVDQASEPRADAEPAARSEVENDAAPVPSGHVDAKPGSAPESEPEAVVLPETEPVPNPTTPSGSAPVAPAEREPVPDAVLRPAAAPEPKAAPNPIPESVLNPRPSAGPAPAAPLEPETTPEPVPGAILPIEPDPFLPVERGPIPPVEPERIPQSTGESSPKDEPESEPTVVLTAIQPVPPAPPPSFPPASPRLEPLMDSPAAPPVAAAPPAVRREPPTPTTPIDAASISPAPPADPTDADKPNTKPAKKAKPRKRHRALFWSLAAVFVLIAAAAGGVIYANHYYADRAAPGATLAGLKVSGQTQAELERTAQGLVSDMRFTFTEGATTLEGTAQDMGVTTDPAAIAKDVLAAGKSDPLWNRLSPWTAKPVVIEPEIDQTQLRQFLDAKFVAKDEVTTDATVAYDPETETFAVVPSVTGLKTQTEPAAQAINAYLADTSAPARLEVESVDDPPAIDDAAAQAAADAATAALSRAITFDNGQDGVKSRTYQLPAASIGAWTKFTADPENGAITVGYDEELINEELPELLADKVAIPSRPQIVVTYPDSDKEIGITQWGLNGLKMADPAPVVTEVAAALQEGRDTTVTVPLESDPFETERTKPPSNYDEANGAHWIDVNKSTFIATLYAGTTQIGSYVISIGKPGHDTPSGTFYVYLKYDHQVMRGPASDPYESPTDWVSYFTGGVAFHSAPWNEPNNWQRRVSHGCVNMKKADSKVVYDFAPIGTKVVVHD